MTATALAYQTPTEQPRRDTTARFAPARLLEDFPFRPLKSQCEAENLMMIDAAQSGESTAWEAYFVETLVEFLLFRARPTARVSAEDETWLLASVGEEPSPSIPALMKALMAQAEDVSPALRACARRLGAA